MEARLTQIDRGEVLRYLLWHGEALPEELDAQLTRLERRLRQLAEPRVVWSVFDYKPDKPLGGTDFCPAGEEIRAFLADCDQVILLAATLGAGLELAQRQLRLRDMSEALILDAMGSAAVENVCDNLCDDLAVQFAPRYLTDRFSPGYGDFPLSQQPWFFRLLDMNRRLGVSLTESGLMVPQKTVTAIVGISDKKQKKRPTGCEACGLREQCIFRKEGKRCGK